MGDPYFVRDDESCMAVNPRSAVPSGSRLFGVVDTDTQYVFFVSMEEWGQVVVQPDITVGPVSEFMSVDPDGAVAEDSVKFYRNNFVGPLFLCFEFVFVPTDAAR